MAFRAELESESESDQRQHPFVFRASEVATPPAAPEAGDVRRLPPAVPMGRITLIPRAGAEGATIYITRGQERRRVPKLPIRIEVPLGQKWRISAVKGGKEVFQEEVEFTDGTTEKTVEISAPFER